MHTQQHWHDFNPSFLWFSPKTSNFVKLACHEKNKAELWLRIFWGSDRASILRPLSSLLHQDFFCFYFFFLNLRLFFPEQRKLPHFKINAFRLFQYILLLLVPLRQYTCVAPLLEILYECALLHICPDFHVLASRGCPVTCGTVDLYLLCNFTTVTMSPWAWSEICVNANIEPKLNRTGWLYFRLLQ